MKKIAKIAVGITLAASVAATAGVLAGCGDKTDNGAYALTHGAGYVGYSLVTLDKEGKIEDVTLSEVCLPTHVKADESVGEDDKVGNYYKTVSYSNVTLTYDESASDYMVGETAFKTYLQTEANAKAYYNAVINNKIQVTVGGVKKTDIMNKNSLSKEENGYWSNVSNAAATEAGYDSQWKWNRDLTVNYVKEHGIDNLLNLTKSGTWSDGTVDTGATWNDLNPTPAPTAYTSYAQLIVNAYNKVAK